MNIINSIRTVLFSYKKKISVQKNTRKVMIYDEEHLKLQRLYEKWICKEKWLLHNEGVPLLFGVNPEHQEIREDVSKKMLELWEHAQECVSEKLLSVINIDDPVDKWEVFVIDLYRWAMISRITVPEEFSALIAFVIQTVQLEENKSVRTTQEHELLLQHHKEIVLGAATSLLINASMQIDVGNVKSVAMNISRLIFENKRQWFGENEPLLDESAMINLINNYIKLTKSIN